MVYYLHDMIEDYDEQKDEDIQWKTSSRKEFFELKGTAKEKKPKHYMLWFWDYDWLGKKYKAIYYGPKLEWMNVYKERKKWKKK